jgi:pSer/pThr/pTyr-binding forkhead associated (FHA) protein
MSKLSRLFGRKPEKSPEVEKPAPTPEDITLMMPSSELTIKEPPPVEGFGLQFHFESGELKSFDRLPLSVGRGEPNDINLTDDSVSSIHAKIYYDERVGSICIEDLHSLNGTFIDNLPTSKNILRDGDKIKTGNFVLTFRDMGFIYQGH